MRFPVRGNRSEHSLKNAAGKALHYSRHSDGLVFADDSGLVVPALAARPSHSARYAGPQDNSQRIEKLLSEMREKQSQRAGISFLRDRAGRNADEHGDRDGSR